jgi:endonuclease-3
MNNVHNLPTTYRTLRDLSAQDLAYLQEKYADIAPILLNFYGDIVWGQGQSPMDELVSCILSQSTTDANRDRGFALLKEAFPTWDDVANAPTPDVVEAIRPAGLANQKAPRIQNALRRIFSERGDYNIDFLANIPIAEAKAWLMSIDGVGPKTAAIVMCFAFNRPAFPVDTHIHRVSQRLGFLSDKTSADDAHPIMEAIVPPHAYYAFHLHLIRLGREICTARRAHCDQCPLTAYCRYYQTVYRTSHEPE